MKMRWVIVLAPVVAALVATIFLAMPFERTHATFFDSVGFVEQGRRFGVDVGVAANDAETILVRSGLIAALHGVSEAVVGEGWRCGGRMMREAESMQIFFDRSWRHGAVCLFRKNDRVVAVAWTFSPLSP